MLPPRVWIFRADPLAIEVCVPGRQPTAEDFPLLAGKSALGGEVTLARNVEIKAWARRWEHQLERARAIARLDGVLVQHDTFYECANGRLKLRTVHNEGDGTSHAVLIFYRRPNQGGPKLSEYALAPVADPAALAPVLAAACGQRAVVRKRRTLFLAGRTRVHFDEVDGLGRFIELEVVLAPEESAEDGVAVADALMTGLAIESDDLIADAYADLLVPSDVDPVGGGA